MGRRGSCPAPSGASAAGAYGVKTIPKLSVFRAATLLCFTEAHRVLQVVPGARHRLPHLRRVLRKTRELRCTFVNLFCSRRAALARLPTQGAAKKLAGLRSQPVECPEVRYWVLQALPH